MNNTEKNHYIVRLNKIEGQVRGVKKLIIKDTEYEEALNQINAIKSALNSVSKIILEEKMGEIIGKEKLQMKADVGREFIKRVERALK